MKYKILNQLKIFWRAVFPVKTLPVHPVWLHFPAIPLEKDFQDYFYDKFLPAIRFALIVSVLIFLSFQVFDFLVTGEFINAAFPVRYFIYLPFSILVIYLTFSPTYREIWNYLVLGWIITTGAAGLICIYLEPVEVQPVSSVGLMVFFSISFYLFGLRPIQALISVVIGLAISLFFMVHWEVVPFVYAYPLVLLIVIIALAGYFIAWRIEFAARHEFYLERRMQGLIQEKDLLYTETLLADQAFMRLNPSYRDNRRMLIADLLTGKVEAVLRHDINQVLGYCLLAEEDCIGQERVKNYFTALKHRILDLTTTAENISTIASLSYNLIKPNQEPINLSALLAGMSEKLSAAGGDALSQNKLIVDIGEEFKGKLVIADPEILGNLISNLTKVLCLAHPAGQLVYRMKYKAERKPTKIAIEITCLGTSPKDNFVYLLDTLIRKSLLMKPLVGFEKEELYLVTAMELATLLNVEIDYQVSEDGQISFEIILAS